MTKEKIWIARDYVKCSGCKKCEIACSLFHEGKIWPEASRIRVFMLVPGAEVPHFCSQCHDYPCVESCPVEALSISQETSAVLVDEGKCTACGNCISACPGKIPHMHPTKNHIAICDLCSGDPQCVKACNKANFDALTLVKRPGNEYACDVYAKTPDETTRNLAIRMYGEKGRELI